MSRSVSCCPRSGSRPSTMTINSGSPDGQTSTTMPNHGSAGTSKSPTTPSWKSCHPFWKTNPSRPPSLNSSWMRNSIDLLLSCSALWLSCLKALKNTFSKLSYREFCLNPRLQSRRLWKALTCNSRLFFTTAVNLIGWISKAPSS